MSCYFIVLSLSMIYGVHTTYDFSYGINAYGSTTANKLVCIKTQYFLVQLAKENVVTDEYLYFNLFSKKPKEYAVKFALTQDAEVFIKNEINCMTQFSDHDDPYHVTIPKTSQNYSDYIVRWIEGGNCWNMGVVAPGFRQLNCSNYYDNIDYNIDAAPTYCIVTKKYDFDMNTYLYSKYSNELQKFKPLNYLNYQIFIFNIGLGLLTLHKKNIIHMNVKLENCLVKYDVRSYDQFDLGLDIGIEDYKRIINGYRRGSHGGGHDLQDTPILSVMHLSGLWSYHIWGETYIQTEKKIDMNIMPIEIVKEMESYDAAMSEDVSSVDSPVGDEEPIVHPSIDYYSFAILLAKMCFNTKKDCKKGDCSELIKAITNEEEEVYQHIKCFKNLSQVKFLRDWIKDILKNPKGYTPLDFLTFLVSLSEQLDEHSDDFFTEVGISGRLKRMQKILLHEKIQKK
eukprot:GHVR01163381.1.p1 GENE.GHVR01163381.1~~GHVR01163381.1.p1  ORF type:complete len:454 (-),score=58.21 GHVR01163381.1:239-1600(-)